MFHSDDIVIITIMNKAVVGRGCRWTNAVNVRGCADTYDVNRQTKVEGIETNRK